VASIDSIENSCSLPALKRCLNITDDCGRKEARDFVEICEKNNFDALTFGSLAWEHLTGLKYFQKKSDIDVLFNVGNNAELFRLCAMLEVIPNNVMNACDIEIVLWNGDAFSWREFINPSCRIMIKNLRKVFLIDKNVLRPLNVKNDSALAEKISYEVTSALYEELETYPKPGLVSHMDSGSHKDMDATHFTNSIASLREYFKGIALAGMRTATMDELRSLGRDAEHTMFLATGGVNTHRGAIFSMGLLAAAAGYKLKNGRTENLGEIIKNLWSENIMDPANEDVQSHGTQVMRRYGLGGAREEAANGFSSVYLNGLPVFKNSLKKHDLNTVKLCSFFAMLENANDTTLLYRGGLEGLEFAKKSAAGMNRDYDTGTDIWKTAALKMHKDFISRNLSPGGVADLLSAVIFIQRIEELCQD